MVGWQHAAYFIQIIWLLYSNLSLDFANQPLKNMNCCLSVDLDSLKKISDSMSALSIEKSKQSKVSVVRIS